MSFSSTESKEKTKVETLFVHFEAESSEEPPMDEWSSLPSRESIINNPKAAAYKRGEYDPGTGEICAEYVVTSDSSVLRHMYYQHPSVKDPGIIQALTLPEPTKHKYNDNGQDLYLDLCEEMNLMPVRKFHRSLVQKEIDLKIDLNAALVDAIIPHDKNVMTAEKDKLSKYLDLAHEYYGVNPVAIRAMSLSLAHNKVVKRLDLTSNFLTDDACYHLGRLLEENHVLDELVLAQCKIGPSGILRIVPPLRLRTMEVLDVSSNALGDEGFQHLANVIERGAEIKRLNLSHNNLGTTSSKLLTEALECNNKITHLNLSWNQLRDVTSCDALIRILSHNKNLVELDFSWNSLTISGGRLQNLVKAKNLQLLNLSNNRLGRSSAESLAKGLIKSKKLKTLDLSFNPLSPKDALLLLETLKNQNTVLVNLVMAGVVVTREFREELKAIKKLPYRGELTVTYDTVIRDYVIHDSKMRPMVLKRLDYIFARSTKKCRVDISLYFMSEYKEHPEEDFIMENAFIKFMKNNNLKVDNDIIDQLVTLFPGPSFDKAGRSIKLSTLIEYTHRLWPDKKLPPTPPPPPPPKEPPKKGLQKKSREKPSKLKK